MNTRSRKIRGTEAGRLEEAKKQQVEESATTLTTPLVAIATGSGTTSLWTPDTQASQKSLNAPLFS